jgi:ethanolamine permease
MPSSWRPAIWVVFYIVFAGLNVLGVALNANILSVITGLSVLVLLSFYCFAPLAPIDFNRWALDDRGRQGWFHGDFRTVAQTMPYSMWFFLGVSRFGADFAPASLSSPQLVPHPRPG